MCDALVAANGHHYLCWLFFLVQLEVFDDMLETFRIDVV
jgi:hypothetical protein